MGLSSIQKERIDIEVINVLVARFEKFPEDASNNRNAPFHTAFLKAFADKLEGNVTNIPFFVSLSSWLHGLNTTLGQTFFENVAHILCNGEKREYTSMRLGNLKINKTQEEAITEIMIDLSTSSKNPNLENENKKLLIDDKSPFTKADDFTADVFFVDEDSVTAIELKSVKPNSGEMRGEKRKILMGKAALLHEFPNKRIDFLVGFPFDPTVNPETERTTDFNKSRFFNSVINLSKFCDFKEVLIAEELWDFLSGEKNTMEGILEIINVIATTSFFDKFQLLRNPSKRNLVEYSNLLVEWYLSSEMELLRNDSVIRQNLGTLGRTYNKSPFDANGKYDWDRYNSLRKLYS